MFWSFISVEVKAYSLKQTCAKVITIISTGWPEFTWIKAEELFKLQTTHKINTIDHVVFIQKETHLKAHWIWG